MGGGGRCRFVDGRRWFLTTRPSAARSDAFGVLPLLPDYYLPNSVDVCWSVVGPTLESRVTPHPLRVKKNISTMTSDSLLLLL